MKIVGCDCHPSWQQVAVFDAETGEITEHKLSHGDGQAEGFYRSLGAGALVGLEAATVSGLSICWSGWATRCGWGMRRRYGPAMFAGKRPTGAMRSEERPVGKEGIC